MSRQPARFARAAMSLVAIVGLFVVLPVALWRVTNSRFDSPNPLSDIGAPWSWTFEQIRTFLAEPLRDDAIVNLFIRASIVIIWIAIAVIAVSVVVEVVHMVRHRGLPSPHVRGLGWAQRPGRWIAIGIIALLPVNSFGNAASAVTSPTPAAMSQQWSQSADVDVVVRDVDEPAGIDSAPVDQPVRNPSPSPGPAPFERADRDTTAPAPTHLVERGDSVFGIAADLTGGDQQQTIALANQILDINLGNVMTDGERFTNPALIQPGWILTLPAGTNVAPAPPAAPGSGEAEPHVVVTGDTLSDIAEEHLGDADSWPAIWEENANTTMVDGRTFDDPNLIIPGWELELPGDDTVPRPEVSTADPTEVGQDIPDDTSDLDTAPRSPADAVPSDAPTPPSGIPRVDVPGIDAERTSVPTSTTPAPADAGSSSDITAPNEPAPRAPSPIRLEHGALLAVGLLTLVGVRRRRALRAALPHARVPAPPPEIAATERRLRVVDAGERAARVDVAVRAAAHHVAGMCQIGSVRVARDGEVIIRFTAPTELDAPWVGAEGGGPTWTLPAAVPIELLAEDARRVGQPCLALVTVGLDDDGRDVLVDLEAARVTRVEAVAEQADDIVRAIGSGLATSLTSEVVHLVVAGLGSACLFDHPNARQLDSASDALDAALALVGSTAANDRTSFDLRSRRTGGEMWEPAVLLFTTEDSASSVLPFNRLPAAGHGVAAVIASPTMGSDDPTVGARLSARTDGWVLDAFGESLSISPIGVTDGDVEEVAHVLEAAEVPVDPAPIHDGVDRVGDDADDVPFTPMPHQIIVSLMGAVQIADADGRLGTFERSKTVELVAWLATHRERATRTAARTALWELDVRDATFANVVSEARRALGRLIAPPDGEEWLARTLNETLPLHALVVTDADLIGQRVDHARLAAPAHAIDVLQPAVEMIRDMPFAGTSYLWPDADGLTSNLVLLATTAAAELAGHALSVGDTDLVFWATSHGLRVLPGHEELIGLRMRAHARSGDLAGVRQEWESYERVIMADSWSDGEPAPKLLDLRRELLSANA